MARISAGGALLRLPSATLCALSDELGLSEDDLSVILRADKRALDRWRTGAIPQGRGREQLNKLEELRERLLASFSVFQARDWLHTPSGYFGALTPLQALRGGGTSVIPQILGALEALETGASL